MHAPLLAQPLPDAKRVNAVLGQTVV